VTSYGEIKEEAREAVLADTLAEPRPGTNSRWAPCSAHSGMGLLGGFTDYDLERKDPRQLVAVLQRVVE
jgi:hypothetical protein